MAQIKEMSTFGEHNIRVNPSPERSLPDYRRVEGSMKPPFSAAGGKNPWQPSKKETGFNV